MNLAVAMAAMVMVTVMAVEVVSLAYSAALS